MELPVVPASSGSRVQYISHQVVAREIMAKQTREIGPGSPSTLQDTEDSHTGYERRIIGVIIEVAMRMGDKERTGRPPDYADR
jgi:hypothetical protein